MDLTPGPEPITIRMYAECPHCAELAHADCYEAGRRAGREDAARDIRPFARRLVARIIANASLLDVPFTDAPDQSPWTRMKPAMHALYDAVGIKFDQVNQPRTVEGDVSGHTSTGSEVERCSCPDIDVTAAGEEPGSRTVKGRRDPECPVHVRCSMTIEGAYCSADPGAVHVCAKEAGEHQQHVCRCGAPFVLVDGHRGVLTLDELPDWERDLLDRQWREQQGRS